MNYMILEVKFSGKCLVLRCLMYVGSLLLIRCDQFLKHKIHSVIERGSHFIKHRSNQSSLTLR